MFNAQLVKLLKQRRVFGKAGSRLLPRRNGRGQVVHAAKPAPQFFRPARGC